MDNAFFHVQSVNERRFDNLSAIYYLLLDRCKKHKVPRLTTDVPVAGLPQPTRTERRSSITTGIGSARFLPLASSDFWSGKKLITEFAYFASLSDSLLTIAWCYDGLHSYWWYIGFDELVLRASYVQSVKNAVERVEVPVEVHDPSSSLHRVSPPTSLPLPSRGSFTKQGVSLISGHTPFQDSLFNFAETNTDCTWNICRQEPEVLSDDSDAEEPSPEALAHYLAMRRHTVSVENSTIGTDVRKKHGGHHNLHAPLRAANIVAGGIRPSALNTLHPPDPGK